MRIPYKRNVHRSRLQFTVPTTVVRQLGLRTKDWIHLIATHPRTGEELFKGDVQMRSGLEIYGPSIRSSLLKKGQLIKVMASLVKGKKRR